MNAQELLIQQTEKQIAQLFAVARRLPADKLDWKPAPGARSALCQLQEVATALPIFWQIYTDRKLDWDPGKMAAWVEERSKLTTLDELEAVAKENTRKLAEFIRELDPEHLTDSVELPFPGERNMADVLGYHFWNASYHEGQITYIESLLAE